jgi:ABC-type sugar transport system substrate-binding protein
MSVLAAMKLFVERRKSLVAVAAFAVLAVVLVAGCGGGSSSSSSSTSSSGGESSESSESGETADTGSVEVPKLKVAYVEIFLEAPIEKRINEAFETAAHHVGWEVDTTDAHGKGQTVAQNFQAAINENVDAIVLGAVEPSLVQPQIKAAKEAGIPMIAVGGESHTSPEIDANYAENDHELSEPLGEQLCEELEPGAEIAILRFDLFLSGKTRGDKIKEMAEACGLKIVAEPNTEQTFSDAQAKTSAILTQYSNLSAIVPVYDTFTSGAAQAIKAANKQEQVDIYSYYADSINAPLMRANKNIVGLVDCDCVKESAYAVEGLLALFGEETPLPKTLPKGYINYEVVTQEDIPPEGQDGPISIEAAMEPYYKKWDATYKYGS